MTPCRVRHRVAGARIPIRSWKPSSDTNTPVLNTHVRLTLDRRVERTARGSLLLSTWQPLSMATSRHPAPCCMAWGMFLDRQASLRLRIRRGHSSIPTPPSSRSRNATFLPPQGPSLNKRLLPVHNPTLLERIQQSPPTCVPNLVWSADLVYIL